MSSRSIEARQGELEAIQGEFLPISKNLPKAHDLDTTFTELSDNEIADKLEKLKQDAKFHAAFIDGDFSDFEDDQSKADFYVCEKLVETFGHNVDLIDNLIMESELMREKWTRPTSGTTYGRITIKNAIAAHAQKQEQKKLEDAQFCKELEAEYGPSITDAEWAEMKAQKPWESTVNITHIDKRDYHIRFNEEWVVVLSPRLRIYRITPYEISSHTLQDFINVHRHLHFYTKGEGKKLVKIPAASAWLANPLRRYADKVVFDPRGSNKPYELNLWQGYNFEEIEATKAYDKCKKYLHHLEHVICNGNADHYKYLMSWLAHMIQKPWQKPCVAIILRGREGVGKGVALKPLLKIVGKHGVSVYHSRQILGNFNSLLSDKLLIFFDEVDGKDLAPGALKTLITEHNMVVERKGQEPIEFESFARVIMASNEAWVVPAGEDARRFFVLDVSPKHKRDFAYFKELFTEIEEGGAEALYTILKHWEITENVRVAPITAGLIEQKKLSFSPVEMFWDAIILEGNFPHASLQYITAEGERVIMCPADTWPEWVHIPSLHGAFLEFCQRQRLSTSSPSYFSKMVMSFVGITSKDRRNKTTQDGTKKLYAWPAHVKCKELWEVRLNGGQ